MNTTTPSTTTGMSYSLTASEPTLDSYSLPELSSLIGQLLAFVYQYIDRQLDLADSASRVAMIVSEFTSRNWLRHLSISELKYAIQSKVDNTPTDTYIRLSVKDIISYVEEYLRSPRAATVREERRAITDTSRLLSVAPPDPEAVRRASYDADLSLLRTAYECYCRDGELHVISPVWRIITRYGLNARFLEKKDYDDILVQAQRALRQSAQQTRDSGRFFSASRIEAAAVLRAISDGHPPHDKVQDEARAIATKYIFSTIQNMGSDIDTIFPAFDASQP